jgi:hypothetical protein
MKASWDDDIPNTWKVIKAMFQTTNQDIDINLASDKCTADVISVYIFRYR